MTITLIEFSVENYKIFKEKQTLSMATDVKDEKRFFLKNGEKLLRSSLIYGQNASGKTTILDALSFVLQGIKVGANTNVKPRYNPFLLSQDSSNGKSFFEIVFIFQDKTFKYNISVLNNKISNENLVEIGEKDKEIFKREDNKIIFNDESETEDRINTLVNSTLDNNLFLGVAASLKNKVCLEIVESFRDINILDGVNSRNDYTEEMISNDDKFKKQVLSFIRKADFGIVDIETEEKDIPDEIKKLFKKGINTPDKITTLTSLHRSKDGENIKFEWGQESKGTQDFFEKIGPIIETLNKGKILFIDELDNSLHPTLTKFIIQLFESSKTNPNNAQLIATTHDTSLIGSINKELLIKDQVWFTEKNEFGEGSLFSLSDMENNDKYLRNDMEFQNKYLEGRFGAVPFINDLEL